jgi:two-component system phosphate regulon response regulator PhoB
MPEIPEQAAAASGECVVVVEDEKDIRTLLELTFRDFGWRPFGADNGRDGLALIARVEPAVVLLDLMLPDVSGIEVCRRVRAEPASRRVGVMMLTARGDEYDRILGFESGADDYVVKPFSIRELMLRIQAILRRPSVTAPAGVPIEFGELKVDRGAHRVWVTGQEVELTALEFKLLATLYDRRNRVQSREALLSDVWGIQADITTRTVDTHVKRLREKLGAAGDYVQTVRGVGYRFAETPDEQAR